MLRNQERNGQPRLILTFIRPERKPITTNNLLILRIRPPLLINPPNKAINTPNTIEGPFHPPQLINILGEVFLEIGGVGEVAGDVF